MSSEASGRTRWWQLWSVPGGVVVGAGVGLLLGVVLGERAVTLTVGACVGLLAGAVVTSAAATPPGRRRVVVALAATILAIGLAVVGVVLLV